MFQTIGKQEVIHNIAPEKIHDLIVNSRIKSEKFVSKIPFMSSKDFFRKLVNDKVNLDYGKRRRFNGLYAKESDTIDEFIDYSLQRLRGKLDDAIESEILALMWEIRYSSKMTGNDIKQMLFSTNKDYRKNNIWYSNAIIADKVFLAKDSEGNRLVDVNGYHLYDISNNRFKPQVLLGRSYEIIQGLEEMIIVLSDLEEMFQVFISEDISVKPLDDGLLISIPYHVNLYNPSAGLIMELVE